MKLKKTAAMVVSAACLTVCAGMSMSASAAGVSTSLPKDILGDVTLNRAKDAASIIDSYKKVVQDYADTHSCSFMYTLLDMDIDGDRIEELIIAPVEPAEGRVAEIYSYIDGSAVKVGEVPMGENGSGTLCYDQRLDSHSPIVVLDGENGSRTAVWYNFYDMGIVEEKRAEEADENFDDLLELGGTVVTYNGDGTWTTVDVRGEAIDGIDMWLIEKIKGDVQVPDDPFEFPEIPADATPVEETLIVYDTFMRYMAEYEEDDDLDDINHIEISVFDMNKDGIPELIIKDGTSEADYAYEFMTYDYNTGLLEYIDADWGGHSALFMDTATGQLCRHYGQMGTGEIVWYDYDGTELTIAKSVEDIDYNGVEDPSSVYAQYGDFVKVDSSYNFRGSDGAWQHVVGEDVFDGFDTSVFDRYLENYNAAQTPTDTTASGTTTSANSTTTAATTTAGKTDSPKTGDNALPMLGAVITIAGLTAFTLRKKND